MITVRYLDYALSARYAPDFHRAYFGEEVDWRDYEARWCIYCDECCALMYEGKRATADYAIAHRSTLRSTLNLCDAHARLWKFRDLFTGPIDKPGSVR